MIYDGYVVLRDEVSEDVDFLMVEPPRGVDFIVVLPDLLGSLLSPGINWCNVGDRAVTIANRMADVIFDVWESAGSVVKPLKSAVLYFFRQHT